jgi:NADPH:quinone reductase-like Zn-dependent oxidoreductase
MSLPSRMNAAYITELGSADTIRYGELPVPVPGPTDVLVRVQATTVNPVDTFVRSGAYATPTPFPFVIGRDLVGTVVAGAGAGAAGFSPGQPVWCNSLGHGGRQGAFAEYAVVPADRLYPAPDEVDPLDLVTAAHPAASAWLALFRYGRVRLGATVFVGGGAGNVGSAAVALAARAGAHVVATARPDDVDFVRSLGAAEVFDYHAADLTDRLRAAVPGGYDVHLDTSGHAALTTAVELLAHRGRMVAMVGLRTEPLLPIGRLYIRDATVVGFAISNATVADLTDAAAGVMELLRAMPWRPRIAGRSPLSQAAEAHRRLESGEVHGRLVLQP